MYSLNWTFFEPESMDCGTVALTATTLEDAEREACELARLWGVSNKKRVFNLALCAQGQRVSYWSTLAPEWVRS